MAKNTKTPVMVLQELAIKKHYPPPTYTIVNSIMGTHINRFDYEVRFGDYVAEGTGASKQVAKHEAAHKMLRILEDYGIYDPRTNPVEEFNASIKKTLKEGEEISLMYIMPLNEYCLENKLPDAVYTEISEVGPPHAKEFTYTCQVGSLTTQATGNTKKKAKHLAAKQMLEQLKDIVPATLHEQGIVRNNKALSGAELSALDLRAMEAATFRLSIQPNMTVKIEESTHTIKKLMLAHDLTLEDLSKYLEQATEENLKEICDKLELKYIFTEMQENPVLVCLSLSTDTPFVMIGVGRDFESAKNNCLQQTFRLLRCFMNIEIN